MTQLPQATRPFVEFSSVLRANGFAVSPDQTIGFVEAIGLLGPADMTDVRRAALAMLTIPHEREEEFDAIFRAFFFGEVTTGVFEDENADVEAHEATGTTHEEIEDPEDEHPGDEASATEQLARREFQSEDRDAVLRRFSRLAPAHLPRRRSYRYRQSRYGRNLHLRKTLQVAARREGEIFELIYRQRQLRQRKIVLLIDISGSMAERTGDYLRFAHTLAGAAERFEAFSLGTRLTRITQALRQRNSIRAFDRISSLVADIDGGTRIGEALQSFLAIPRYAGFARGALVIMVSDGLERGSPQAMIDGVDRLSRLAWQLFWVSPLAVDGMEPQTAAMTTIRPYLNVLADGTDMGQFTDQLLRLEKAS